MVLGNLRWWRCPNGATGCGLEMAGLGIVLDSAMKAVDRERQAGLAAAERLRREADATYRRERQRIEDARRDEEYRYRQSVRPSAGAVIQDRQAKSARTLLEQQREDEAYNYEQSVRPSAGAVIQDRRAARQHQNLEQQQKSGETQKSLMQAAIAGDFLLGGVFAETSRLWNQFNSDNPSRTIDGAAYYVPSKGNFGSVQGKWEDGKAFSFPLEKFTEYFGLRPMVNEQTGNLSLVPAGGKAEKGSGKTHTDTDGRLWNISGTQAEQVNTGDARFGGASGAGGGGSGSKYWQDANHLAELLKDDPQYKDLTRGERIAAVYNMVKRSRSDEDRTMTFYMDAYLALSRDDKKNAERDFIKQHGQKAFNYLFDNLKRPFAGAGANLNSGGALTLPGPEEIKEIVKRQGNHKLDTQ